MKELWIFLDYLFEMRDNEQEESSKFTSYQVKGKGNAICGAV